VLELAKLIACHEQQFLPHRTRWQVWECLVSCVCVCDISTSGHSVYFTVACCWHVSTMLVSLKLCIGW